MKFIFAHSKVRNTKQGEKLCHWIKILEDNGQEKWYNASKEVHDYAKQSLQKDNVVVLETTPDNRGGAEITRITKAAGDTTPPATATPPPASSGAPVCTDCGKALKDGKYKKCYTCNQKNPAPKTGGYQKSPEVQESIKRQAIMKSSADAVATAFVGQVQDIPTLGDMIIQLYEKLLPKV